MTTALEQAFPLNANWPAATVRSKLAEAMIGVFQTADLSGEDFSIQPYPAIAVYGADGDLELYAYDATDTTTADDGGISCIVVSGRRYIKRGEVVVSDAAISAITDTQPSSPSLGDTYVVPASPSGDDWAGNAKTVAQYTARGWLFRQPFVGMMVYVEDEDAIYHYDSAGDWNKGLPVGAIADGSIPPKKLALPFAILKVEDQRNAPPGGSPTVGTMYQVGTSPTGDFASHTNEVARWNEQGEWEFIAPAEGDTIYRKDVGTLYTYRSGAWVATIASPVVVQSYYVGDTTSSTSTGSTTSRVSSPSITAKVGQKIRVTVQLKTASVTAPSTSFAQFGIRVDSASTFAVVLMTVGYSSDVSASSFAPNGMAVLIAEIDVPDASAHVYSFATRNASGTATVANVVARAIFEVIQPS